ncbi:MAG TPA: prepilin-type N-terminal cleavage/methylation domain-containing protein [Chthoniobacteraceae bacterium]|nr:prepilin-type N-terminal cleavage/methylation domain-containing protein [Chthoniobacteraceae bacterium]
MKTTLQPPRPNRRSGMSLVEMLVVIAVVVALLALLFPALGRMREASKEVACLANLRNYGSALLTAISDHGGLPAWNGLGPGEQTGGSTYPSYDVWLIPEYLPAKLRCPLASELEKKQALGFSYGASAGLAQFFPKLKAIPAPSHRVVLASETYGTSHWSSTQLNMAMWGVSDPNAKDERMKLHEGSVRRPQFHGTKARRGLNLFLLDGHAALVRPAGGDWYQPPTYGDATNGGYFYDRVQFGKIYRGTMKVQ